MKCLLCCRDKLKSEKGFTLLEMLLVITISSLLAVIFLQLILNLYQNNKFFNLQNAWQLDAYLAVDFMAAQIKNSKKVEVISGQEINIFTYYDQNYQWLKFSLYQSGASNALGRSIGSSDLANKDFGKNLDLIDKIEELNFRIMEPGLLKITLYLVEGQTQLTVSRLIKI
ncbi:prepilin-type N-terminal cleavage/methylation domain-containing protein [Halanaerobium saccharolyticum]|uniref:Prepilin-type N-terminal cleavage/methylation domain-containing protein n=1 Tax=Halanaerobium saccharolyticum TaxID=43595 RepID=A0A4R7ZA20_9FIRM|nr:type II secretion system protein [Halanaerobium saccharolyticum]RAK11041.1 prepilin-type N-terminal cleavage/methylation domain-containing protein [Halanaerobium saccharolyticum]TDW06892.1 prepilin-type N-terminal cleavage/methylation domain-containing protein [Halanaerobium saccharolyticum]TDX63657.1 prepilin-type N-terminal cleavage/methylation domain-containing protein [Halanaerobium saccharolyticum]